MEAIEAKNAADVNAARERGEASKSSIRLRLPEDDEGIRNWAKAIFPGWYQWNAFEVAAIAPREARGKKFSHVRDKFLTPIRHAIAHGFLDSDGVIDLNDPVLRDRADYWLPYMRMFARLLIFERCGFVKDSVKP